MLDLSNLGELQETISRRPKRAGIAFDCDLKFSLL